jgi:eukaryotic-like serine/threonine-protein kinase
MKTCPRCNLRYPSEAVYCFIDGADLVPLRDARIGTTVAGRYLIEEVIGEGGMATVYRAIQKLTGRPWAIKMMTAALARQPIVRERFRREAKSAQKLAHPNIIEIFDQGETEDGTVYLVMELLKGHALADVVGKGPLELQRALRLMTQMARGIARAHDLDVIHRDLKPENIFIVELEGGVELIKILDFGIAHSKQDSRLTGAGEIFGTPQYMAPERITAAEPGPAGDLYSLGVVYFEMLAGKLPFEASDIATYFKKHLQEPPRSLRSLNPLIPVPLDNLVLRLLAKDPKDRPVDAHRVHADLLEMARDADVFIPGVPESQAEAERTIGTARPRAPTRPTVEAWARRLPVFQEMLSRSYGSAPPREMVSLLDQIRENIPRISATRAASMEEQRALATIEEKGREGRQRFGFAVDALGLDSSKAKDEVRVVQVHLATVRERKEQAAARFLATHVEILRWEGRSAFQEPYPDLAEAYRQAASAVDVWSAERDAERKASSLLEANERAVSDLDFQIQALRAALATHEREIEAERDVREKQMLKLGTQADELEAELLALATRFCEPLRARPELSPLFEQLEADVAA